MENQSRKWPRMLTVMVLSAAVVCAAAGMLVGILQAQKTLTAKGLETTENNIRRGAVMCYALEGRYPESLSYLMEHYSITFNEARYIVHYEVFAPNLMPEITVVNR